MALLNDSDFLMIDESEALRPIVISPETIIQLPGEHNGIDERNPRPKRRIPVGWIKLPGTSGWLPGDWEPPLPPPPPEIVGPLPEPPPPQTPPAAPQALPIEPLLANYSREFLQDDSGNMYRVIARREIPLEVVLASADLVASAEAYVTAHPELESIINVRMYNFQLEYTGSAPDLTDQTVDVGVPDTPQFD